MRPVPFHAIVVGVVAACGAPVDCGADGVHHADATGEYCAYPTHAAERGCPPGLPHLVHTALFTPPQWRDVCTSAPPGEDFTLPLPAEVCDAAGGLSGALSGCTGVVADDGGACCPYSGDCTNGAHGGWAPRPEHCPRPWGYDGAFRAETDERGCPYLDPRGFCSGGETCCLE